MTETYRLTRADYLRALNWNGTVWMSGDAEVNPSMELEAEGLLLDCATRAAYAE